MSIMVSMTIMVIMVHVTDDVMSSMLTRMPANEEVLHVEEDLGAEGPAELR